PSSMRASTARRSPIAIASVRASPDGAARREEEALPHEATCTSLELRKVSGAVTDGLDGHSGAIEQRHEQICVRGVLGIDQVLPALDAAAGMPEDRQRQGTGIVQIAVAHSASVEHDGVI